MNLYGRGASSVALTRRATPIDAVERIERLAAFRAGVMGDLVVVGVVHVDHGRAAVDLLHDERRAEGPKGDVGRRPRDGYGMPLCIDGSMPRRCARLAW